MGCEELTLPPHGEVVMGRIRALWREQMLADYTIVAEGRVFKVHKIVLAALSEYFKAAFGSGMLEVVRDRLEMKGVSAASLTLILDFFYTGHLLLSRDNIGEVLACAVFLQCDIVVERCCQFLESNLNLDNYSDVASLVDTYHLPQVQKILQDYQLKYFHKFAKSQHYLDLSVDSLSDLLKEDSLKCTSDYRLYKLVMRWVKHDKVNREEHVAFLLQYIRFPHMTFDELNQIRKNNGIFDEPACKAYLDEALQFKANPELQVLCDFPRSVPRCPEYLVTFGCSEVAMHSCVLYKGHWHTLSGALGQPKPFVNAAAVVVNNHLFICGGHTGGNSPPSKATYCYRPASSRWTRLESMETPRRNMAMVADNQTGFYVFGGITTEGLVTSSVERYSIRDNVWTPQTPMARELADLAACRIGDIIYLAGGMDDNCFHTSEFKEYNTNSGVWNQLPDIRRIKFRPKLFNVDTKLYLVDVYRTDGGSAQMETYDVISRQWTNLDLPTVCFSRYFGAATIGDWLYFVGKNNIDDGKCKKYNFRTNEVVEMATYPFAVDSPLCCVLKLQQKFIKIKMLEAED